MDVGSQRLGSLLRRPRRIVDFGPAALLLEWEQRIDPGISAGVYAYAAALDSHPAVVACVPAYCSLLLHFAPPRITAYALREHIYALRKSDFPTGAITSTGGFTQHDIPVCYGGAYGPDLAAVARVQGLTEEAVVELHGSVNYHVFQLGFRPGFPFLGLTPPPLRVGRRAAPRPRVAAGSVGLADRQTGIYPSESPGGWQIIGRTPVALVDASAAVARRRPDRLFLIHPNDRVRFHPISAAEFEALTRQHRAT